MPSFTKGQKADTRKMRREKIPLPEVGADVYLTVRALTRREVLDHTQRVKQAAGQPPAAGELRDSDYAVLALCVVDDEGTPLFGSEEECKEGMLDLAFSSKIAAVQTLLRISGVDADAGQARAGN